MRGSDVGFIVCIVVDGIVARSKRVSGQLSERSLFFEFTALEELNVLDRLVGTICHFGTSFTSALLDDAESVFSGFFGFINLNLGFDGSAS